MVIKLTKEKPKSSAIRLEVEKGPSEFLYLEIQQVFNKCSGLNKYVNNVQ